ncbi:MAG: cation:dicarboxylase symporter family transporter [Flavobacteriaceae bacterium]|nr:cation:dicarboxylase symporter family transporter [Flavobacteriaceae bacterium]
MSLSTKIIIGLLFGIIIGLFFGEYCSFFEVIGDGFVGLLQMTVLPYIMVSIISNLGRMSLEDGKVMVVNGLKVLLLLLGIGVVALLVLPLALPTWVSSSFFSPSIVAVEEPLNFLELYIPSNPFGSMSNNVVPAVVLFSIFLGIGLSKVENKKGLLEGMDVIGEALNHINKMVIKMTPYGVFAIAAYNAGTMSFEEIQRLHAYIIIYTIAVLLLGFYWLPLLISATTGIKPKELFEATKSTLLTIFATGKIIVVLPQLIENVKDLMKKQKDTSEESLAMTEIMMPLAYPFPNLGTFVIFIFVPFTAWYMGNSFSLIETATFIGATSLSSFVAPIIGIPFLLDLFKLPQEMFQLFVISSVYTDRIRVVLGAIHLIALTLISIKLTLGGLNISWAKLSRGIVVGIGITIVTIMLTRVYLTYTLGKSEQYESFVEMKLEKDYKKGTIKKLAVLKADSVQYRSSNQIRTIRNRGVLRVGYFYNSLPYAFKNDNAELVGFDIEMAYLLAEELNVVPEFYRVNRSEMTKMLRTGQIDIVMSGSVSTTRGLESYSLTNSHTDQTLAFVVPDHNRELFSSKESILNQKDLKIGYMNSYFKSKIKQLLPNVELIKLDSPRPYFKGEIEGMDALLFSAEAGSAWTIIYPSFNVSVLQPNMIKLPSTYPIVKDDSWILFVNTWLQLKEKDGTINKLFDYWIEGKGAHLVEPRWSVIKDVLHWVE